MVTRADDNGPFKEFVLDEWLRDQFKEKEREQKKGRFYHPSEIRHRLRKTFRGELLAVRKVLDKAIDYIDNQEAQARRA